MPMMPTMPVSLPPVTPPDNDKAARAAELQARIQNRLATVGLGASGTPQAGY